MFKAKCPVPKSFVEKLIIECVEKEAIQDLSVLFCEGCWAVGCDASCVPLDLVLKWDIKNCKHFVTVLLEQKALARGLPNSTTSPLSICLEMDNSELGVILLQHGADENDLAKNDEDSILHAALQMGLKKGENRNKFLKEN